MSEVKKFIERVDKQIKGNKVIVVDMATSKVIMAIRNKFKTLYPMFISQIEMKDAKVRTNLYKDLRTEMKRAAELCDLMLGERGRIATQDEIKEFVQISKSIDGAVQHLTEIIGKNKKLRKIVTEVENQTSMSVEGIKRATKVFSENIEKKQGRHGGLLQSSNDLIYAASGLLEGDMNPGGKMSGASGFLGLALGPLAPLAKFGLNGAYSVRKKIKERKRAREILGGEIGLTAKELGIDAGSLDSFRRSRNMGDPIGNKIGNPMMNNTVENLFKQYGVNPGFIGEGAAKQPRATRQGGINIPFPNVSPAGSGRGGSDEILGALNQFYSFGAFRAPYTKKMLELLEKSGGGKVGAGMGGISGVIPAITSALPFLKKAAAISFPAVIGWKLGEWIEKNLKVNGRPVGEHVQSFAEKNIFHKVDQIQALDNDQNQSVIDFAKRLKREHPEMSPEEISYQASLMRIGHGTGKMKEIQARLREGQTLEQAVTQETGLGMRQKLPSVSAVDQQIKTIQAQQSTPELVNAMNEIKELLKKQNSSSSLVSVGRESKNDPFLDLLNTGNLGEDF